ncbi:Uncharacterised protein [Mycobacteroides abscessus subsp. abscessus]|nr:Uncharacterised protein [Mycobacteroides abscessus subsp. abscessus]
MLTEEPGAIRTAKSVAARLLIVIAASTDGSPDATATRSPPASAAEMSRCSYDGVMPYSSGTSHICM